MISGAVRVGTVFTAAGALGPAPVTLKYPWTANGVAITGATASPYTPWTAMLGKAPDGNRDGSKDSDGGIRSHRRARGMRPAPVTLKYQWYANGMPISGEVRSTYTPMLRGYAISVSVTGTKSGFTTATMTSAATEPVT